MAGAELPEGQFGPLLQGTARGPRWRRRVAYLAAAVGVGMLLGVTTIAGVLWYGTQQVGRVEVPALAVPGDVDGDDVPDIEELEEVLNVLVVGSDSREGLTDDQLEALGTEREDGTRTDSIIVVQLDPRREQVAMLSFPRDLLVTRCDGSRGRINAAYEIGERDGTGGPSCLVETVVDFTGIPVHHFVQVDFAGFIDVVDALGGVTIYLEEPLADAHAGLDLPAGCVELDGTTALGFVRARRLDSDFGRIARQQRFVREVVAEAASVGTLVNVPRLLSLVDAGARAVETDRDLSVGHMRRIAYSLRNLEPDRIDTRTVPAVPRTIDGVAFVVAIEEDAERLFEAFRNAEVEPGDLGTDEPRPVTVADVPPVTVLNGSGVAGIAARASDQLQHQGFEVAGTDNADRFDVERTQVIYAAERLEEAELLAEALGGASLVPDEGDEALTVVLGADYAPDRPDGEATEVAVDDSPAPSPTPTPEQAFAGATPSDGHCR